MPLIPQQATVSPYLRRDSQTHTGRLSLLWDHCSFLLGSGAHKVLFVPSMICFSSPVEVLKSNPTDLKSQISWGYSVPLPDPQVGKSVLGPRTFATVWEFFWYNCSPVCESPAWWLYSGANDDFLQEDLCLARALKASALGQPEGWGRERGGRGVQDGETYVHLWVIHVNVWQKPPQ